MGYTMFAAIQVGSSEMSMKICEISKKNGIREMNYIRRPIEIGAETYRNNKISHNTINNICDILSDFKEIMQEFAVTEYVAAVSSAIREAKNSVMVLDRIRIATGIKVKILSNSEKRFLYYKAIALKREEFKKIIGQSTAIVDVGAGSIQISLYDNGSLVSTQNIRIGFLRIMEMLAEFSEQTSNYSLLIEEYINSDLDTFKELYLNNLKIGNIIAVGDNINELSRVCLKGMKSSYVTKNTFEEFYDRMLDISPQFLAKQLSINSEQAEFILPTAMIYKKIFEISGAESMWFPQVHLNDGIAVDFAQKNENVFMEHDFSADIVLASRNIAAKYRCDIKHNSNIEYITLKLFDSLKKIHGMGKRERLLAQIAAILHNCGAYINMNEVLINSYNIIMSTEIIGLSHSERLMVANIVKAIKYDLPDLSELGNSVNKEEYIIVSKITAILRLAYAMDISHLQKFDNISIDVSAGVMNIISHTLADITLEKGLFEKKSVFFTEVYGIKPKIKRKK